jgi:hypothetical protein
MLRADSGRSVAQHAPCGVPSNRHARRTAPGELLLGAPDCLVSLRDGVPAHVMPHVWEAINASELIGAIEPLRTEF